VRRLDRHDAQPPPAQSRGGGGNGTRADAAGVTGTARQSRPAVAGSTPGWRGLAGLFAAESPRQEGVRGAVSGPGGAASAVRTPPEGRQTFRGTVSPPAIREVKMEEPTWWEAEGEKA